MVIALSPPKKGPKMKKKEDFMLEDDEETSMDDEFDDIDMEEDELEEDEEEGLFGMDESGEEDMEIETFAEDLLSAFKAEDSKMIATVLREFRDYVKGY
jgi:hypothetical protein